MSNSFASIAKKMDDLQVLIVKKDAETKDFADKAVAAHAARQELEAELAATRSELSAALEAITGFLGSLTVLPSLVSAADNVHDAEIAAKEAADAAAAQAESNRIEFEHLEAERLAKEKADKEAADKVAADFAAEVERAKEEARKLEEEALKLFPESTPKPVAEIVPAPAAAPQLDPLTGLPKPPL